MSTEQPEPATAQDGASNPYRSPETTDAVRKSRFTKFEFSRPFITGLVLSIFTVVIVSISQRIAMNAYANLDMELPTATEFALSLGYRILTFLLVAAHVLKEWAVAKRVNKRLLNIAAALAAIGLLLGYLVCVLLPIFGAFFSLRGLL